MLDLPPGWHFSPPAPDRNFGYSARAWRCLGLRSERCVIHDGKRLRRTIRNRRAYVVRTGIGSSAEAALAHLRERLAGVALP